MKFQQVALAVALAVCVGTANSAWAQKVTADPKLPEYTAVNGISGNLRIVGSDTMKNVVTSWGEGFQKFYPSVQFDINCKGSNTAPTALIEGLAHFGPMSREMSANENNRFAGKFGYAPTAVPTSIDMLAVIVRKDNPLKSLTMAQVDAIFSRTRKGGFEKNIATWGDLGLEGEWAEKPISLYGRNNVSGTYVYFKEHALLNGDYKESVKEQIGTAQVVHEVAKDKYAMGYGGIGYVTSEVRAVPLAKNAKAKPIEASAENAYKGEYPMARALYLYLNYKPKSELDPLRREFIKYVLSKQGQEDVIKDGYFPMPQTVAARVLKSVGIGE